MDLLQADYFREWSWVRSLHPVHSRLPLTTAVLKALGGVGEGWKPATMKWKPDGTWPADMTPAHVKTAAQAEAAMEALVADGGQAAQPVREEEAALRQARRVFYAARAGVGAAAAPAAAAEPAPGPREAAAGPAPAQEPGPPPCGSSAGNGKTPRIRSMWRLRPRRPQLLRLQPLQRLRPQLPRHPLSRQPRAPAATPWVDRRIQTTGRCTVRTAASGS